MFSRFLRVHAPLLALTLAASGSQAQPACLDVVTVGSWNIQYFGKTGKAPNVQRAEDIAAYIALSGVDVLALQEMSTTVDGAAPGRNAALDKVVAQLASTGKGAWQYELFGKRDGAREPADQWTGVRWNTQRVSRVDAMKVPIVVDPQREQTIAKGFKTDETVISWSRHPNAVKFSAGSGKTDFVLIPLHMKSNVGDPDNVPEGEGTSAARRYEAELLVAALPALKARFNDDDISVLGDTNMLDALPALKGEDSCFNGRCP